MKRHKQALLSAILLLCLCAPALRKTDDTTIPFRDVPFLPQRREVFDGVCDINLRGRRIRASARISTPDTNTDIAIIDEMGVPLAQISAGSQGITVLRFFPPVTRISAAETGLALVCFGMAVSKGYANEPRLISMSSVIPGLNAVLHTSGGSPDSIVTAGKKGGLGRAYFSNGRYDALRRNGDTLVTFFY